MTICGVQRIVSRKTGEVFAKVHILEPVGKDQGVGQISTTEFFPFTSDLYDLVGRDVKITYRKGFGGQAIVDTIEPV